MERTEIERAKVLSKLIIGHVNRYNAGCLVGLNPERASDEGDRPELSYSCLCRLTNDETANRFAFQHRHISGDLENIQFLANRIGVPNLAVMVINNEAGIPGDEYLTPFKRLHPTWEEWGLTNDELIDQEQRHVVECRDWARFLREMDEML